MSLSEQQKVMYQPVEHVIHKLMPFFKGFGTINFPLAKDLNIGFEQINANQKPLCFVDQNKQLPEQHLGYEERIYQNGIIATRKDNWHDFFNAVVWHTFPEIKTAINSNHIDELHKQKDSLRSRKRDLLTLFDESGVIIIANDSILELIKQHKWQELFIENKQNWLNKNIKIVTFGHALYEKYLNPYIGMTAQALLLNPMKKNLTSFISEGLLNNSILQNKSEMSPLPLLGIPGWQKNQNKAFYTNQKYFR